MQYLDTNAPAGKKSCDSLIPKWWRATRVTKTSPKNPRDQKPGPSHGTDDPNMKPDWELKTHCARFSVEALITQLWPAVICMMTDGGCW